MTVAGFGDLESILRRIAAGARVTGAAWVAILVLAAYATTRDAMDRPWLPIVVAAGCAGWAILSVQWSVSAPQRLLSAGPLVVDGAIAVATLVAVAATGPGVLTYYGGLPLIVVAIACIRGRREGWLMALVLIGVTVALRPGGVAGSIGSIVLYAAGSAVFSWVIRVLRQADASRLRAESERTTAESAAARAEERVAISRHLHDSVLQTLALIQRRDDLPAEVTVLARRQERELRDWLFGAPDHAGGFNDAVARLAADSEARHHVPVEVVASGDGPMTDAASALVAAAGEAISNAATHSGAPSVSVFTEVTEEAFRIFVRDRGSGFEPDRVPEDRHGVRHSILGRLRERAGSAHVRSESGWGTEWRLEVPR